MILTFKFLLFFYAFRTPAETDRDSSILDYISTYLSGGESSVLYKKLVDQKQMALAVQSYQYRTRGLQHVCSVSSSTRRD